MATKGFQSFAASLKERPLVYISQDHEDPAKRYIGTFCPQCVGAATAAYKNICAKKLSAREVWNYNYACTACGWKGR